MNELADKVEAAGVEEEFGKEERAREDLNPEEILETGNEVDPNEPVEKEGEAEQDQQEALEETKVELDEQMDQGAIEDINEQLGEDLPLSDIEEFRRKTSSSSEGDDSLEPHL